MEECYTDNKRKNISYDNVKIYYKNGDIELIQKCNRGIPNGDFMAFSKDGDLKYYCENNSKNNYIINIEKEYKEEKYEKKFL